MTSQKTVEKLRVKVKELEDANTVLLNNNLRLAEQLKQKTDVITECTRTIETVRAEKAELQIAKDECRKKCDLAVAERERKIQEKEMYIKGLRSTAQNLRDANWHREVKDIDGGLQIVLTIILNKR